MCHLEPHQSFIIGDGQKPHSLVVRPAEPIPVEDLLSGSIDPPQPLVFLPHLGRIPWDLLPTAHARLYLISGRFRRTLMENAFTGWKTYPVQVYGEEGKPLSEYFGWSITGRCGEIDNTKGHAEEILPEGAVRPIEMLRGLVFDSESWDGSHVFLSPGWGYRFCTECVAAAIKKAALTNIKLTRASEHLRPSF